MYGMVNLAIGEFLRSQYGESAWDETKARSRTDVDTFLTMDQYPDELSFELIAAASHVTGNPVPQLFEELGEFWIGFAERSGYGELMAILGNDLVEALENIDNLHSRVAFAFPDLLPPSFWITDKEGHSLVLHYQSVRTGMAPMILGLVRGLARRYGQAVEVRHLDSPSDNHHRFRVVLS
jgi:hypothetical protein